MSFQVAKYRDQYFFFQLNIYWTSSKKCNEKPYLKKRRIAVGYKETSIIFGDSMHR